MDLVEIHCAQTRSLGCDEAFDSPTEDDSRLGLAGFEASGLGPHKIPHEDMAWRSLTSTWKGTSPEKVKRAQALREGWKYLCSDYQAKGLGEQRRPQRELGTIGMEPGEDPKIFTPRIDRNVSERKRPRNGDSGESSPRIHHQLIG